jgi:S1-C subfamily serine protease
MQRIRFSDREMGGCCCIRSSAGTGTAFLHSNENGSYWVTAAHVVRGTRAGDVVQFLRQDGWRDVEVKEILLEPNGYDVAVFSARNFGTTGVMAPVSVPGIHLGEELKFLGFPHGLKNTYPVDGASTPLVRTAFFSGVIAVNGLEVELLDGFNNPGFSGGPVYGPREGGEPGVVAVVSGFRPERAAHARVYRLTEAGEEEQLPDLYTKPNSGMINAISIEKVKALASNLNSYNPVRAD